MRCLRAVWQMELQVGGPLSLGAQPLQRLGGTQVEAGAALIAEYAPVHRNAAWGCSLAARFGVPVWMVWGYSASHTFGSVTKPRISVSRVTRLPLSQFPQVDSLMSGSSPSVTESA